MVRISAELFQLSPAHETGIIFNTTACAATAQLHWLHENSSAASLLLLLLLHHKMHSTSDRANAFANAKVVHGLLQGGPASPRPGLPSNPAIDVPELKSMDSRRSVKLRELLRECAAVKFDLQKGPLFRINLFKVCPQSSACSLSPAVLCRSSSLNLHSLQTHVC